MARSRPKSKQIETITHGEASRKNIPTAEHQAVMAEDDRNPIQVPYERRNRDLDPQLVWRGKDVQDWSDLLVQAPPLFIQEKVHPKVLIEDLRRRSQETEAGTTNLALRRICLRISTGCQTQKPRRSSTSTTPTGQTG